MQAHVQTCECMCECEHLSSSVCSLALCTCQSVYIPQLFLLFIVGLKHCFISHPARVVHSVHKLAVRQASQVSPAALCFCECVRVGLEVQLHVTYRSSEQHLVSGLFFLCSVSPKLSDVCLVLRARGEHEKGREQSRFALNKVADACVVYRKLGTSFNCKY